MGYSFVNIYDNLHREEKHTRGPIGLGCWITSLISISRSLYDENVLVSSAIAPVEAGVGEVGEVEVEAVELEVELEVPRRAGKEAALAQVAAGAPVGAVGR